jgi:hypothetical protein
MTIISETTSYSQNYLVEDHVLAATDVYWEHPSSDLAYWQEMNRLPLCKRYWKYASDILVSKFVRITCYFREHNLLNFNFFDNRVNKFYDAYTDYISRRSDLNLQNRNIVVILTSARDENRTFVVDPKKYQKIEDQSGYDIVCISGSKVSDFAHSISRLHDNHNHIKALWVRAHGSPERIEFGEIAPSSSMRLDEHSAETDTSFNPFNQPLMQTLCSKLDPDAPIVLESCCTGAQLPNKQKNIAQLFAINAEGRKVYAPSTITIDADISFEKREWHVQLKNFKEPKSFNIYSLLDRIKIIWYTLRLYTEDVTATFTDLPTKTLPLRPTCADKNFRRRLLA